MKDNFQKELKKEIKKIEKYVSDRAINVIRVTLQSMIMASPVWAGEYSANHKVFVIKDGAVSGLSGDYVHGYYGPNITGAIPPEMPEAMKREWKAEAVLKSFETIVKLRNYAPEAFDAIMIKSESGHADAVEYGWAPVRRPYAIYKKGELQARAILGA